MKNIAASMTLLGSNTRPNPIAGKTLTIRSYVHVKWEWLILPSILILAGTAFFIATVLTSRKHNARLWKNSILAAFFHGLEDHATKNAPTNESMTEMKRVAEITTVRLEEHEGEGRTVLVKESLGSGNKAKHSMRQRPAAHGSTLLAGTYEMLPQQSARTPAVDPPDLKEPRTW